mmetsp:Transcript_75598/g.133893  ORF Transcript_75598/g.133893 Transcript_75598/m.133893 type:complete len:121 (+) Transcript_75598:645-1007(+)
MSNSVKRDPIRRELAIRVAGKSEQNAAVGCKARRSDANGFNEVLVPLAVGFPLDRKLELKEVSSAPCCLCSVGVEVCPRQQRPAQVREVNTSKILCMDADIDKDFASSQLRADNLNNLLS